MIYSLTIVYSILFFVAIIILVRNNKLDRKNSILWLIFAMLNLLVVAFNKGIDLLTLKLGISYSPSLILFTVIGLLNMYIIHLSIVETKQNRKIVNLVQELAILKNMVKNMKKINDK